MHSMRTHGFEKAESAISGLCFKRDFLQCGKWDGVIGVIEADNFNARLDAIDERLKGIAGSPLRMRSSHR